MCPVVCLLLVMAVFACAAGVTGLMLAHTGAVFLVGPIARELPPDRQVSFIADLWAHIVSYAVGLVGGIVVMVLAWRSRGEVVGGQTGEPGSCI